MSMIKNISKAEVLVLKDQVAYQEGQVVSKTLAQNDALSVTLFSFDKGEEISTHESGGDAFVTCLDGVMAKNMSYMKGNQLLCRQSIRMQCTEKSSLRCCLSLYFNKNM